MRPEEYKSVLDRLERLERRDRRMRLERVLLLAAIVWLLATGPASRLLTNAAPKLRAGERGVSLVAKSSLAGLRHLLRVQPVLDPSTVIEDEREAFNEPTQAPSPARPSTAPTPVRVLASSRPPAAPDSRPTTELKSREPKPSTPLTASSAHGTEASRAVRLKRVSGASSRPVPSTVSTTVLTSKSAASTSWAAAGLSIDRDVQKRLTSLPGDGSSQTLALAEWPDLASAASPGTALPAAGAGPIAILPEAFRGAAASLISASPAEAPAPPAAVPQTPVALKALGYAQGADGSAQIVLSNGNALLVVNEGQEFLDRFRVVSLRPEGVDVEDRFTSQVIHLAFGH